MKHVDEALRDYYRRQGLREETLARLELMAKSSQIEATRDNRLKRYAMIAAAFMLCLVSASYFITDYLQHLDTARLVAKEIALNHTKQLAIEFYANDYVLLQQQMVKLDFKLVPSKTVEDKGLHLVGARYCTIQGQLAAQLKLRDVAGKSYTLYQTPLSTRFENLPRYKRQLNGVYVHQWQEGGMFLGLAVLD